MDWSLFFLASFLLSSMVWQVGAGQNVSNFGRDQMYRCASDIDCPSENACAQSVCINPCEFFEMQCICQVVDHKASCIPSCPNGICETPVLCMQDMDCNSEEACIDGHCINPCKVTNPQCDSFSTCVTVEHRVYCKCFNPAFYYKCPVRIQGQYYQEPFSEPRKKTFYIPDVEATWSEAMNYCQMNGLNLATINDAKENRLAVLAAERKCLTWSVFWIAGRYHEDDHRWWWQIDSQSKGEPIERYNNFHLFMETVAFGDCLAYFSITPIGLVVQGYRWAGKPCNHKHFFICEKYE